MEQIWFFWRYGDLVFLRFGIWSVGDLEDTGLVGLLTF